MDGGERASFMVALDSAAIMTCMLYHQYTLLLDMKEWVLSGGALVP